MNDLDIIKELEIILGRKISEVPKGRKHRGYSTNSRKQVTSVNLALYLDYFRRNNNVFGLLSKLKHLSALSVNDYDDNYVEESPSTFGVKGIIDIRPLAKLKKLSSLSLCSLDISNIEPLKGLKNLAALNLNFNFKVSDLSPLKELKQLTTLSIMHNQISDISHLGSLEKLTSLNINSNDISDLSPLQELKHLSVLDASFGNGIRDINPISKIKQLHTLNLMSNSISDVAPLQYLEHLTSLNLMDNQISDVAPLQYLEYLTSLHLLVNQISDITPLQYLRNLEDLNLGANQIEDISSLNKRTKLRFLNLENNKVNDIEPLKELLTSTRNIPKTIYLQNNKIKKLPLWIRKSPTPLSWGILKNHICLEGNPLQTPSPEVVQQGRDAIQSYFKNILKNKEYITGLSSSQPSYPWLKTDNLILKYKYQFFLPENFFSKVILATREHAINENLIWKHGIILARKGAGAEIIEIDDARTIQIKVAGKNRREFIRIITAIIDELNVEYGDLKAKKVIP